MKRKVVAEAAAKLLSYTIVSTPLGDMLIVADDEAIILAQFVDRHQIQQYLCKHFSCNMQYNPQAPILKLACNELLQYFSSNLQHFSVSIKLQGTIFQQKTWQALQAIAYGTTVSYQQIACTIGSMKAIRAVGNANGKNPVVIFVPCHRVIRASGDLGGYNAGLERKIWLLRHEKSLS